jgi:hypothetical protein
MRLQKEEKIKVMNNLIYDNIKSTDAIISSIRRVQRMPTEKVTLFSAKFYIPGRGPHLPSVSRQWWASYQQPRGRSTTQTKTLVHPWLSTERSVSPITLRHSRVTSA